jgi:hypothetical protein
MRRALIATLPAYCAYGCGRLLTHPSEMNAAHVIDGNPDAGVMASCVSCNQLARARNQRLRREARP